jgi:GMP synthase (glutamine-hydrolysing)
MGEVNKADLNLLREADAILLDELKVSGYYTKRGRHLRYF